MSVLFKLKQRASQKAKAEVARTLEDRFQSHPEPAFPGTHAAELANIFELDVPLSKAKTIVRVLSGLSAVEYAEIEPKRQLFGVTPQ